jgi:hypothetical protein
LLGKAAAAVETVKGLSADAVNDVQLNADEVTEV